MPSPDKLFRLDPVETKVTAPVSTFQGLAAAADQSVANRSLGRGLTAFSTALGQLAQFKKEEQIREDIKTAKDAAVRGEVMPDVLPIAEKAYQNTVDINTSHQSLLDIGRYKDGDEFATLLKNPDLESSQKTAGIEQVYDDFYARAAQTIQNPDTLQKLRLSVNSLKEVAYKEVYEQEKNQRTIQGVKAGQAVLAQAVKFAEATGVPLKDTLTGDWIKANVKDLGVSHPFIPEDERKLMFFQILTTNADVIGDQDVIQNIMNEEFSNGFSYNNLLLGKGEDADEFRKIYNTYVTASKQHFKAIEDGQKAATTKIKMQ